MRSSPFYSDGLNFYVLGKRIKSLNKILSALMRCIPGVGSALLLTTILFAIYAIIAVEEFRDFGESGGDLHQQAWLAVYHVHATACSATHAVLHAAAVAVDALDSESRSPSQDTSGTGAAYAPRALQGAGADIWKPGNVTAPLTRCAVTLPSRTFVG